MIRRIAFAVGDTAGHVRPALAIAEAYDSFAADVDVRLLRPRAVRPRAWPPQRGGPSKSCPRQRLARASPLARIGALARVRPRHSRGAGSLAAALAHGS